MAAPRSALILAVAAIALAGCAKKHVVDQVPDEALDAIPAAASAQLNAPVMPSITRCARRTSTTG